MTSCYLNEKGNIDLSELKRLLIEPVRTIIMFYISYYDRGVHVKTNVFNNIMVPIMRCHATSFNWDLATYPPPTHCSDHTSNFPLHAHGKAHHRFDLSFKSDLDQYKLEN